MLQYVLGTRRGDLVSEVTTAGENHRDAMFVASGDDVFVFLGSARLDDGDDAGFGSSMDRIGEGEERIRSEDASLRAFARFVDGDFHAIDAAHLAGADTDEGSIAR